MLRLFWYLLWFWIVRPSTFFVNAVGTLKNIPGYTTAFGNRGASVKTFSWNAAQYPAGGFQINIQTFGLRGFDIVLAGLSALSNYDVNVQVAAGSPKKAFVHLMVLATGAEVAVGAVLVADTVQLIAIGG